VVVAALHTENSVAMPAGMPTISGRGAILELMNSSLGQMPPSARFSFRPLEVKRGGDWAVERGATPGTELFPAGKYVMLYEREADGCWRIAWTITNLDAMPATQ
jgi:ketosteroid isomerase-like protein